MLSLAEEKCMDHSHCGDAAGHGYTKDKCDVYEQVKKFCPKLCGAC